MPRVLPMNRRTRSAGLRPAATSRATDVVKSNASFTRPVLRLTEPRSDTVSWFIMVPLRGQRPVEATQRDLLVTILYDNRNRPHPRTTPFLHVHWCSSV